MPLADSPGTSLGFKGGDAYLLALSQLSGWHLFWVPLLGPFWVLFWGAPLWRGAVRRQGTDQALVSPLSKPSEKRASAKAPTACDLQLDV